jgi:hypothetical protein
MVDRLKRDGYSAYYYLQSGHWRVEVMDYTPLTTDPNTELELQRRGINLG